TLASGGTITNGTTFIGAMDAGGYFTLDANLIPDQPGPISLDITVSYTDDFNQPKTIRQTLPIEVQEMSSQPDPGSQQPGGVPGGKPGSIINPGGGDITPVPETFSEKLVRALKGLIGLDSGHPQNTVPVIGPSEIPSQNGANPSKPIIIPAPGIKGG
ncbi:MAG TPA: hypothetical protein VGJ97_00095, partial [Anaerolineaceae bacterium]